MTRKVVLPLAVVWTMGTFLVLQMTSFGVSRFGVATARVEVVKVLDVRVVVSVIESRRCGALTWCVPCEPSTVSSFDVGV